MWLPTELLNTVNYNDATDVPSEGEPAYHSRTQDITFCLYLWLSYWALFVFCKLLFILSFVFHFFKMMFWKYLWYLSPPYQPLCMIIPFFFLCVYHVLYSLTNIGWPIQCDGVSTNKRHVFNCNCTHCFLFPNVIHYVIIILTVVILCRI